MLVSQQIVEIAANLNRTSAEVSAQSIRLLNSWQRDWNARWPYNDQIQTSASFALSADTQTYSLASDMDKLYAMYIPELKTRLSYLTLDQLKAVAPSNTTGTPQAFAPFGAQQVMIYPIPDTAYTVEYAYYKFLDDIIDTATSALSVQTLVVDPKYHEGGIQYATYHIAQRMGDGDTFAFAKSEYERIFALALADWSTKVGGKKQAKVGADYVQSNGIPINKIDQFFWS